MCILRPCIWVVVLCVAGVSARGSECSLADNPYALDARTSCGPLCVGFIDRYFGGASDYESVVDLCPPGAFGVTLQQADQALQALGYHTRTVWMTPTRLKQLGHPCMLHIRTADRLGHFVVCTQWCPEQDSVEVFDPPQRLEEVTMHELKKRLAGPAIVVSDKPLAPAEELLRTPWSWQDVVGIELCVVGLVFLVLGRREWRAFIPRSNRAAVTGAILLALQSGCDRPAAIDRAALDGSHAVDMGAVMVGTDLRVTFPVENRSGRSFRIQSVERSCDCEAVRFDAEQQIPPGGTGSVSVVVPTRGESGSLERRFTVHTSSVDEDYAAIPLLVRADVRATLRAFPSQLMFGSVTGAATRQLRVQTNPPELAARYVSAIAPKFIDVSLIDQSRAGMVFSVRLSPDAPEGILTGAISLKFDIPEPSQLHVAVLGRKMVLLTVTPARLLLDDRVGQQIAEVRVASTSEQSFRLLDTSAPPNVDVLTEADSTEQRYRLKCVVMNANDLDGKAITIATDLGDDHSLQIPISVR